jgi:NADH dehydrogenase/NADH:ubiquinone oxidoreductase subunit G
VKRSNGIGVGDGVVIRGFCRVQVKSHQGYAGRSPKAGGFVKVDSKRLPFFKRRKGLKDRADYPWTPKSRRSMKMKDVKKDLVAATKELKALSKKIGQLATKLTRTAVEELEHAQAAIRLKSPAQHAADALKVLTRQTDKLIRAVKKFEKEKAAKRRKAKPARKAPAKSASVKKRAAKKAAPMTATDQVLKIIKRSKKGVDVPTLMKKTGYDRKKIADILFRASKQGKVKRVSRGVYRGVGGTS